MLGRLAVAPLAMTPRRYSAVEGARRDVTAPAELHHPPGHDLRAPATTHATGVATSRHTRATSSFDPLSEGLTA